MRCTGRHAMGDGMTLGWILLLLLSVVVVLVCLHEPIGTQRRR